jgi:virginiamycin B lyase
LPTTITPFPVATPNVSPTALTAGPDGNLWYPVLSGTQAGGVRGIGRITPAGTITQFALAGGVGSPSTLTVGPDDNLWFSEGAQLGRITPAGTITEFPLPSPAFAGGSLTVGSDANLWFYETGLTPSIDRVSL